MALFPLNGWSGASYILYSWDIYYINFNFPLCTAILFQILSWTRRSLTAHMLSLLFFWFLTSHHVSFSMSSWIHETCPALSLLAPHYGKDLAKKDKSLNSSVPPTERKSLSKNIHLHKINWVWSLGSELPVTCTHMCWRPAMSMSFMWLKPRLSESERRDKNDNWRAWSWKAS